MGILRGLDVNFDWPVQKVNRDLSSSVHSSTIESDQKAPEKKQLQIEVSRARRREYLVTTKEERASLKELIAFG